MTTAPITALCIAEDSDRPEAEMFIGLAAEGIKVHVMCWPHARHFQRLKEAGLEVTGFEIERKLDFSAIGRIRQELHRRHYDVLHLFNNRTVLNGLIAARGVPVKVIAYRGIVGNVSLLSPTSWLRYLNPRVNRIVCVAEAIRQYFLNLRLFGLRVPPTKVVTIYKGHDLAWYRDPPLDLTTLGIPSGEFVIGCVANWRPRKGIEVLIDAFGRLPQEVPAHLVLVGDMRDARLQSLIESHPYRSRIHLLGVRRDAPAVVAACNVAVLASLKREGLPKTVIEAMAYAVPNIVTNVGGSPELVENEVSGLVIRPGDPEALAHAILRLQREPDLARTLGRRGRERIATHFSIHTTITKTAALYRELAVAGA